LIIFDMRRRAMWWELLYLLWPEEDKIRIASS